MAEAESMCGPEVADGVVSCDVVRIRQLNVHIGAATAIPFRRKVWSGEKGGKRINFNLK